MKESTKQDYSINGVKPINSSDMTQYSAGELKENDSNAGKRSHMFQKGNQAAKGNHKPRTRLNDRFLADTLALWHTHGNQALRDMLERKPEAFCTMVASLLPKHVELDSKDGITWVINAAPALSTDEWLEQHNLIEQDKE